MMRGFAEFYYSFRYILEITFGGYREALNIEVRCIPYSGASRYAHFCRERV